MTMQMPLAAADAHAAPSGPVALALGAHTVTVDHESGPTPLELMTGALAACSAMTARTHLARDGDIGDVEVVVTLDAGPPTLLYRGSCCRGGCPGPTPTASPTRWSAPS